MLLQRTQVSRLLVSSRLQQTCRIAHRSNSTESPNSEERVEKRKNTVPLLVPEHRTAYLRTSKFLESPAEAFALIRAIERKYGAVSEYKFTRDYEVPTKYQSIVHVTFREMESFERVPVSSETLQVNLPSTVPNQPGGVGLAELEAIIERQEYVQDVQIPAFGRIVDNVVESGGKETTDKASNTIHVRVERSVLPFFSPAPSSSPAYSREPNTTARNFIKWGGFHDLQPIPADTPMPNEKLFCASNIDHIRMRRLLRKYCNQLNVPNPYEIIPGSDIQSTTQLSQEKSDSNPPWEPLPGHESVPEDAPMPSAVKSIHAQSLDVTDTTASPLISVTPNAPIPSTAPTATPTTSTTPFTEPIAKSETDPIVLSTNQQTQESSSPQKNQTPSDKKPHIAENKGTISSKELGSQALQERNSQQQEKPSEEDRSPVGEQEKMGGVQGKLKKFLGGWV